MQTRNKLFCVNDTLRLNLVNVGFEHRLKRGAKCLLRELKLRKDLLHLYNGDAASALSVCLLQRVVKLELLQVHFGHVNLIEEDPVVNRATLLLIQLILYHFELARQNRHAPLHQSLLEVCVRQHPRLLRVLAL